MNRGSARFAFVALALAAMLVVVAIPTPASASSESQAGPCAGFSLLPPVVHADPACLEGGSGTQSPFDVSARTQLLGTQVQWEYLDDPDVVIEYELFRGESPTNLNQIAEFNVSEQRVTEGEYFDHWRPASTGEVWYAVGAVIQEDEESEPRFVMSDAYLVQVTD